MGTRTPLNLSGTERAELERVARRPSTPQALARWCRVILLDDGEDMTYAEIGEELSMREQTVLRLSRFPIPVSTRSKRRVSRSHTLTPPQE